MHFGSRLVPWVKLEKRLSQYAYICLGGPTRLEPKPRCLEIHGSMDFIESSGPTSPRGLMVLAAHGPEWHKGFDGSPGAWQTRHRVGQGCCSHDGHNIFCCELEVFCSHWQWNNDQQLPGPSLCVLVCLSMRGHVFICAVGSWIILIMGAVGLTREETEVMGIGMYI